jgi:hypothetical protein
MSECPVIEALSRSPCLVKTRGTAVEDDCGPTAVVEVVCRPTV